MDNSISYPKFMHKGIVINVEDFPGTIEVASSTFNRNFHYIPEIRMTP